MQTGQRPIRPHFTDTFLIVAFLCAIYAPWVDQFLRADSERGPARELRQPAPRPPLSWNPEDLWRFPDRYEAYFKDSFGLRDVLIRWHSVVKLFGFGVSPTPSVFPGKDEGWLFYTGDQSVAVQRGLMPFTEHELEEWRLMLELHKDWLADDGIAHLYVIAPNKESVYLDLYPDRYNKVGPTRLEQLERYLSEHSTLQILDLRTALSAEKRPGPIEEYPYFPLGTHWNGRGSYIAYRAILDRLRDRFPAMKPYELSELTRVVIPGAGDSWAKSMYVDDWMPQTEVRYLAHPPKARIVRETEWGPRRRITTEVADPSLPRALMFHDSFGPYIEQLLAEHFSHLTCVWLSHLDTALVQAEKPDVVIEMYVERALVSQTPSHAIPRNKNAQARSFNGSMDVRYALDPGRESPELAPEGETKIARAIVDGEACVEIEMRTGADMALLPELEMPEGKALVLYFDIEAPAATVLDVFYKLPGDTDYKRRQHVEVELAHGRNQAFVRLDQPGIEGRLCFRPGRLATRYVLHALEVRALELP